MGWRHGERSQIALPVTVDAEPPHYRGLPAGRFQTTLYTVRMPPRSG